MKNLTPEMIEKAKAAKSAEELLEVAKAGGVEMTADEAATYFAQLNPQSGELDDDALDGVAGGCGDRSENGNPVKVGDKVRITSEQCCPTCGGKIGWISAPLYGEAYISCDQCEDEICDPTDCSYDIIG